MPNRSTVTMKNVQNSPAQVSLHSPTQLPDAGSFLWNKNMLLQVNCRGYVNAQFMQPEPSKYAYGPNLEAKTFIQPEHSYYSHHPGRFFYIKDEQTGETFSAPYEPMRVALDAFCFNASENNISWQLEHLGLAVEITVTLATEDVLELWSLTVKNLTDKPRKISIYPYFSIGYMSWMNQSADFNLELNAIVADSVTAYQKVEDYFKNQKLKDKTFFIADKTPTAWLANQKAFEGEGGLHNPDALNAEHLSNNAAIYQTPVAVMQFQQTLAINECCENQFLFGPAKDEQEIAELKAKYMGADKRETTQLAYQQYLNKGKGCLTLAINEEQDRDLNDFSAFVNAWLPRQIFYHGDVNRLTTDPQTRNYVQDNMGMAYIAPENTRKAFLLTLSQQHFNGEMPDGILLTSEATLKYINQIPHTDHGVWLAICLKAYLDETGDVSILHETTTFVDSDEPCTVSKHIELALDWLLNDTDERGLSLISQGDWCDPMNMVGYKGKGVSAWLSLATAYALKSWCALIEEYLDEQLIDAEKTKQLSEYRFAATAINQAVNQHLWHKQWFARGITDDNRVFGTNKDDEGKIFLNAQSWAILSGAANHQQQKSMLAAIDERLMTPFGAMMLAPSYTKMVADVGRITQKHPGVSENGSVYNHAAIFYCYALYQTNQADRAFELLEKMLPDINSCEKTGQLPVFIPNYYRGAFYQFPEQAGRSSQLFNTGTVAWVYRCLVEELCGLKGCRLGLTVAPKLPTKINQLSGTRAFRGAVIEFVIEKSAQVAVMEMTLDNTPVQGNCLGHLQAGQHYKLQIKLPK